jgi:very-short-patch-repair endonuclease
MREESATPERLLAAIAQRQHGVVTFDQLLGVGISSSAVSRRVQSGRLCRLHRRVYSIGLSRLGNEGRWLAAVLATDGVLSHRTGGEHLKLLPPSQGYVDVTITGHGGRAKRPGIRIHRSHTLLADDVVVRDGIRVTTPARTLLDLRRVLPPAEFRKAVRQAEVLGYGLGGVEVDGTRSELEYLFLKLCRRHRLPPPEVNVRVGPYVVDFLWRREGVVVETDGRQFHRGELAAETDRRRDVELRRLGFEVRRFSYQQVTRSRGVVAAEVREALGGWRAIPATRE